MTKDEINYNIRNTYYPVKICTECADKYARNNIGNNSELIDWNYHGCDICGNTTELQPTENYGGMRGNNWIGAAEENINHRVSRLSEKIKTPSKLPDLGSQAELEFWENRALKNKVSITTLHSGPNNDKRRN